MLKAISVEHIYFIEKTQILFLVLTVAKCTALLIFSGVSRGMWVGSVDERESKGNRLFDYF